MTCFLSISPTGTRRSGGGSRLMTPSGDLRPSSRQTIPQKGNQRPCSRAAAMSSLQMSLGRSSFSKCKCTMSNSTNCFSACVPGAIIQMRIIRCKHKLTHPQTRADTQIDMRIHTSTHMHTHTGAVGEEKSRWCPSAKHGRPGPSRSSSPTAKRCVCVYLCVCECVSVH